MADDMQTLRALQRAFFDRAERWEWAGLSYKVLSIVSGAVVVLTGWKPIGAPVIALIFGVAGWFFSWRAGKARGAGESLLSKLDMADSFGWNISGKELSDLWVDVPQWMEAKLPAFTIDKEWFATKKPKGPARAVENIEEAAWWSKHLAKRAGQIYGVVSIVMVGLAVAVLLISMQTVQDFDHLSNLARSMTSVIMFVVFGDFVKSALKFMSFSQTCGRIESRAGDLLKDEPGEVDAIKLVYEYQYGRRSAPKVPTALYDGMKKKLNIVWDKHRNR